MVVKFSRYSTHMKRPKDAPAAIARFFQRADALENRVGPTLLRLPGRFGPHVERLDDTWRAMPRGVRVAVELRHDGWFTDATGDVLERDNAALCLADRGSRPVTPVRRTADGGYVRFHEGAASPRPCYGRTALASWAERAGLWPPTAEGLRVLQR